MDLQFDENGAPYFMWGKHIICLEKDPVTEKRYKEKAEQELRETPEVVEAALEELKKLLRGEPNLVVPLDKDDFLIKFLRPCKFYAKSAFKRIQEYYKFRLSHHEQCADLTPTAARVAFESNVVAVLSPRDQHGRRTMLIQEYYKFRLSHHEQCADLTPTAARVAFESNVVAVLSPRDQHGRRTMLVDSASWNTRDVTAADLFRGVQIALEAAMEEPRTQISGVVTIMDMRGLSFSQIMQFTPSFAKMIVDWIQDCIPIRLKAVHIINQPYIFNMLFAIFKPFLRDKLRSRIHFHGTNKESLLAHIDASALRKRHGGSLPEPEIPGDKLWQMLHHYEDQFIVANSYGYTKKNKK